MDKQIKFSTNIFNLNSNINEILNYTDSNILLMYHLNGFLCNTFIEFCDINKTNKNFIRFISKNNFYAYCTTVEEKNYFENLKNWGVNIVDIHLGEDKFFDKKEKTVTDKIEVGHYRINKKWVHKYITEKRKEIFYNVKEQYKEFFMPKFDLAIMNPPYDGNLHLKILEMVITMADKVVNISPVRWLQDPLAKYKKNSDYKKFENSIAKHIESLDIVTGEKATSLFNADFVSDLGIYTIGNGDFEYINFNSNKIIDKVVSNNCKKLFDVLEQNMIKGWRVRISEMRPVPTFAPNSNVTKSFTFETTHYIHSWIYNNGYTPDGKTYWTDNNTVKGSRDKSKIGDPLPLSLYFKTQDEAINYEKSTKTKFHRYLVLKMKTDAHFPLKYIPYMSDYTQPWDNKRFCDYFGITGYIDDEHAGSGSEWELILNTMEEIK